MANIKSAQKRIKVTLVKTLRNKMIKSSLKTTIKKFEAAVVGGNGEEAKVAYVNKTYNDDLVHPNCPDIYITSYDFK
jgi:small subunit ribosomal protein S20